MGRLNYPPEPFSLVEETDEPTRRIIEFKPPEGYENWELKDQYFERVSQKLFKVWAIWGTLVGEEAFQKLVETNLEKNGDRKKLAERLLMIMDLLGKTLSSTDIVEEFTWSLAAPSPPDSS